MDEIREEFEVNNPVLILSYNALPLLKRCVESVRNQDAPTQIVVLDNGSSDGSREWTCEQWLIAVVIL